MNLSQAFCQVATVRRILLLPSSAAWKAASSVRAASTVGRLVDRAQRRSHLLAVLIDTNRIAARIRCTVQVCTVVCGQVASTASGKPVEPVAAHDQHVAHAAVAQLGAHPGPELGPLDGLHPNPSTCLTPSRSTPTARCAALLRT